MAYNSSAKPEIHIPLNPLENWAETVKLLDLPDRKQFRLVDANTKTGLQRLESIASFPHLAPEVRIFCLKQRQRLRAFSGVLEWEKSLNLPGNPAFCSEHCFRFCDEEEHYYSLDEHSETEEIMKYETWKMISEKTKETLYQEYEANVRAEHLEQRIMIRQGNELFPAEGERIVDRLARTIAKFTKLKVFLLVLHRNHM